MRGAGHLERRIGPDGKQLTNKQGELVWRLRVDIDPDPHTGRRRQASKTVFGTERSAKQALVRFIGEVDAGRRDRGTDAKTVDQLLDDWLEQAGPDMSPNTRWEFGNSARRYLRPHLGHIVVSKLTTYDVDRAYRTLTKEGGKDGRPLAPATVKKAHIVLTLALELALKWKWVTENVARSADPPQVPRRAATPPKTDQCRALIDAAEERDEDWATFIRLAAAVGARRSELCALRWSMVDLDANSVAIIRAVIFTDETLLVREYPKTAAGRRRLAIDAGTAAALRAHRQRQRVRALEVGTHPVADPFLFSTHPDGSVPWHPHVVTHRFRRLRTAVGAEGVRFHDLRAYVATQLLAAGMDPVSVAGRLGHSRPSVTMTTYAEWIPARDQASAEMMGDLLDREGG